jgi:type II secretory pathway component GspD/PulD (secretin)
MHFYNHEEIIMKGLINLLALLSLLYVKPTEAAKAYGILIGNSFNFMANGTGTCTITNPDSNANSYASSLLAFDRDIQSDCTSNKFVKIYGTQSYSCSFSAITPTLASISPVTSPLIAECEGDIAARPFVVPEF